MKTMKSIAFALLIATGAIASARGEQFRTDINPALLYYQAFSMAPDLSKTNRDILFANDWRGQKLPERFGALVAEYDNQFKLVRRAAHATVPCDWGIDMSAGPATLLPYLARAKSVSQTARLRALWDLQNGRATEACDDLLAALALGRNLTRDGTVISVLVQFAIENIVFGTVAEKFQHFPPETLKQLMDGLDAAPARGTVASFIPTEKYTWNDWLPRKILELRKANPGNDAKVMAGIREVFAMIVTSPEQNETNLWERLTKAAGGTSDGVIQVMHESQRVYERLAVIMALPRLEYEDQMKQLSAEVQKSSNPVLSVTFPAFEGCRPKEFRILVELAMVRAAVEYKLRGEEGLKSVMDPCGNGPFAFQRFIFEGVDRGFQLKSAYDGGGIPEVFIFVEKEGPPFRVNGPHAGQPLRKSSEAEMFRQRYGLPPGK